MTLREMLRRILKDGRPYDVQDHCYYCTQHIYKPHFESCPWRIAKEWLEKQEEATT